MYFVINVIGILVFLGMGVLFSKKRREIQWRSVGTLLLLNLFIAWFLTSFSIGREIIVAAAAAFNWLVSVAYEGIAFAFPDWVHVEQMNFFTSALMPILLVVPMFDILTYIGILPHGENTVCISAKTGEGTGALLAAVEKALARKSRQVVLHIPYSELGLLDELHRTAAVLRTEYLDRCVEAEVIVKPEQYGKVERLIAPEE